jgi:hypothetical protein
MPITNDSPSLIDPQMTTEPYNGYTGSYGTTDNTFTLDLPMIQIPVPTPMHQVGWPLELLQERRHIIAALDGSIVMQCPTCKRYEVLPPAEHTATCHAHSIEVPDDRWAHTSGGISSTSNLDWRPNFTTQTYQQRIVGEWRIK